LAADLLRLVLDTNVLLAGLVSKSSASQKEQNRDSSGRSRTGRSKTGQTSKTVESRGGVVTRGVPFPPPAHRTGRAGFPHPARGEGSLLSGAASGWGPTSARAGQTPAGASDSSSNARPDGRSYGSEPADLLKTTGEGARATVWSREKRTGCGNKS
jgi:hypothetical protein